MRVAPPTDFPVARRGSWAVASALLAALSIGAAGAAAVWHLGVDRAAVVSGHLLVLAGLAVLAAQAGAACWAWRRLVLSAPRILRWDGAAWSLRPGHAPTDAPAVALIGSPRIEIALGTVLLISVREKSGRRLWLPVARAERPQAWHGLRVALRQPLLPEAVPLPVPREVAA